jgi:hypothetical protein
MSAPSPDLPKGGTTRRQDLSWRRHARHEFTASCICAQVPRITSWNFDIGPDIHDLRPLFRASLIGATRLLAQMPQAPSLPQGTMSSWRARCRSWRAAAPYLMRHFYACFALMCLALPHSSLSRPLLDAHIRSAVVICIAKKVKTVEAHPYHYPL